MAKSAMSAKSRSLMKCYTAVGVFLVAIGSRVGNAQRPIELTIAAGPRLCSKHVGSRSARRHRPARRHRLAAARHGARPARRGGLHIARARRPGFRISLGERFVRDIGRCLRATSYSIAVAAVHHQRGGGVLSQPIVRIDDTLRRPRRRRRAVRRARVVMVCRIARASPHGSALDDLDPGNSWAEVLIVVGCCWQSPITNDQRS